MLSAMQFKVAPSPHGRALIALLLSLLALPLLAPALDPSFALSQYAKRHWQVEQGLPQNYMTSLTQDPSGLLIVGTSGGVAYFDGVQFTPVVLDEETGISREWINSIAIDGSGRLWIFSRDAGTYIWQSGRSRRVEGLAPAPASALRRKNGAIVLVGGGLREAANGKLRLMSDIGGGDLSWQGVTELPDGRLLVCDEDGLFAIESTGPRRLLATGPTYGRPLSVSYGPTGSVYLGTTLGLFRISVGESFQAVAMRGVSGPVVNIVEDRDGQVWAATWGEGLFRLHQGVASRWSQSDGLADDFVHTLLEDREGNLWIGTRAGLSRWHSGPIVPYGPPEGLDALFVSHVAGHPKHGLWIGTWRRGMHQFKNGRFHMLNLRFPVERTLLRALTFAPGGGVWFSDWGGHLHHLPLAEGELGQEQVFTSSALGYNASVRCMLFDRSGGFWVGSIEGLFHYPDGSVNAGAVRRIAQREIRALLEARDGTIWAGTIHGLTAIRGATATEIEQLPHQTIVALAEDSHSRVWAATRANGIALVEGNRVRVFDQRHGLPPLPVYAILEDRFERLWLSTPAGLFAVTLSQLEELIEGTRRTLHPLRFLQEDGLRSIEFHNVGDPPAWRDADGHLWFSSVAGLVEVRPEKLWPPQPPHVVVRDVRSADRIHHITYTASGLNGAEYTEFRYRVASLQAGWIPLGTQRVLRLDTLPPGTHHIEIAARRNRSVWGEPATITVTQTPRWFESLWFYAICMVALAALLWATYRWRVSLVRARFALVAEERNRIAREWHDTLLAGFSALSWQLDSARKALPPEGAQAADHSIQVACDMLRHYRTEARRVIWDLRHFAPKRENLPGALERTLCDILPGGDIAHRVETEGDFTRLSAELSQALLRICQEAAFNAARHAEASEIIIRLRATATHAEAFVRDDGKGFDPTQIGPGHFGLSIMRERASHFGGTVEIESAPGKGTQVRVRLPLQGIQR